MPVVLVVDDSPTMRKMIMTALGRIVPSFGEAGSGLEAIEQLALRHYDGLVLDLNMPDMHGLEVIAFIRRHTAYREMPILVLTTRSDDDSRRAALAAGANEFMTKPFTPDKLSAAVGALLELKPNAAG